MKPDAKAPDQARAPYTADERRPMQGWHFIEEDLAEEALDDLAEAGVAEIELLLAKHARFRAFLKETGRE